MRVCAYVYTGWHPTPERDRTFHEGFTEWELVRESAPRFPGHAQPRVPTLGPYDDRDPVAVERRLALARAHGVDAFVYGIFWCRGKRVFETALERGYLASPTGSRTPFAVMWANRMPRRVLPVRRADLPVIDPARRVSSDIEDFVRLIETCAREYFHRENYLRVEGRLYFSIFDSTFFLKELGLEGVRDALRAARTWLSDHGFPDLHVAAIEPSAEWLPRVAAAGFDSVTHYVFLPRWKGPALQDYDEEARARAAEWSSFAARSDLPYCPSVAPGWDASPRGADFGATRPDRYPWSPVVTGESPARFAEALERARDFTAGVALEDAPLFVASLNEWSEGHYLEPDARFGNGWLEALRSVR